MQKGIFNSMSPLLQILLILAIAGVSMIVFSILGFLILIPFYGFNEIFSAFSSNDAAMLRFFQILQSFAVFVVPSVIAAYLFSKKPAHYLGFESPNKILIILALVSFIGCPPMISFLAQINDSMVFPEFLKSLEYKMRLTENITNELIYKFLDTNNLLIITINIFMMVILPAFGEELLFRGTLQPLIGRIFKNDHVAVWLTAFIFSAIHFQFLTFLPRFVLGAMLGYLFIYGKSIWYPIAGHLLNNLFSIIVFYYYRYTQPDINPLDTHGDEFGTLMIIASFINVVLFIYLFKKFSDKYKKTVQTRLPG